MKALVCTLQLPHGQPVLYHPSDQEHQYREQIGGDFVENDVLVGDLDVLPDYIVGL